MLPDPGQRSKGESSSFMPNKCSMPRRIARRWFILVIALTATVNAWGQAASQQLTREKNETAETAADPGEPASALTDAQTTTKPSAPTKQKKTTTAKPKKEKRGRIVVAPIPISSPAVGSGLLFVAGYVSKLNRMIKSHRRPCLVSLVRLRAMVRAAAVSVGVCTSARTSIRRLLRQARARQF